MSGNDEQQDKEQAKTGSGGESHVHMFDGCKFDAVKVLRPTEFWDNPCLLDGVKFLRWVCQISNESDSKVLPIGMVSKTRAGTYDTEESCAVCIFCRAPFDSVRLRRMRHLSPRAKSRMRVPSLG